MPSQHNSLQMLVLNLSVCFSSKSRFCIGISEHMGSGKHPRGWPGEGHSTSLGWSGIYRPPFL